METCVKLEKINNWGIELQKRPFVIAGPCSAESEEQVIKTALELSKSNRIDAFRAGIWKPRTRPNSFQGIGSLGLRWLRQVKKLTALPLATEVANAKHVYEALKYEIDILWIGARTSANPFAVQEIADALKGLDVTVLVKNPINPELELWIGAIERINNAGVTKIGAIHRGFSGLGKSPYRNMPQWSIPIELRRRIPDLPIICDPSHMGGKRNLIYGISQKALDLNYNGLIIETHIDPDNALSDAKQQLTPESLCEVLQKLVIRNINTNNLSFLNKLEDLRFKIDKLDNELIDLMSERMKIAKEIGQYKKDNNITVLQAHRWNAIVEKIEKIALDKGLSKKFISKVFKAIHLESINHQMKIMNS